ncbi:MAG: hypothetical protein R2688_09805 [Fimbriimonadaceae bacterium]
MAITHAETNDCPAARELHEAGTKRKRASPAESEHRHETPQSLDSSPKQNGSPTLDYSGKTSLDQPAKKQKVEPANTTRYHPGNRRKENTPSPFIHKRQ